MRGVLNPERPRDKPGRPRHEPDDKLVAEAVKRTEGVSAAFIKELMRRVAQAVVSRGEARPKEAAAPSERDLGQALDNMLFSGGR